MRKQFIHCRARSTAVRRCPWAAVAAQVEDGYLCFESRAEYHTWRNQQ